MFIITGPRGPLQTLLIPDSGEHPCAEGWPRAGGLFLGSPGFLVYLSHSTWGMILRDKHMSLFHSLVSSGHTMCILTEKWNGMDNVHWR